MKTDAEVLLMKRERAKGITQELAAARTGMSVRTVRTYERLSQLPSQRTHPRTHRTRTNPFADDWPWICAQLERDPALQATLFVPDPGLVARQRVLDAIKRRHGTDAIVWASLLPFPPP